MRSPRPVTAAFGGQRKHAAADLNFVYNFDVPARRKHRGRTMWGAIIQFVAPMALDVVRERLLVRREASGGSADRHGVDMESRLLALQSQVEALHQAEAQQIDELTKVLGAIGLRATVALWLGISSVITTLALLLFTIFKA